MIQYVCIHVEKIVCIMVDEEERERERGRERADKLSAGSIKHVMPSASNNSWNEERWRRERKRKEGKGRVL